MDLPTPIAQLLEPGMVTPPKVAQDARTLQVLLQTQIDLIAGLPPVTSQTRTIRGFELGADAEGTMYVAQIHAAHPSTMAIDPTREIPASNARVDFEKCAQGDGPLGNAWSNLLGRLPGNATVFSVRVDIGGAGGAPMIGLLYDAPAS